MVNREIVLGDSPVLVRVQLVKPLLRVLFVLGRLLGAQIELRSYELKLDSITY